MKKVIFALLFAATALMGCDNTEQQGEGNKPTTDTFYGILIDNAMVTNRGDYYNQDSGLDNFTFRFSTTGMQDGEEVAVSYLTLEIDLALDENGRIPEGTYSVANGDIYPGEVGNYVTGSFFVDYTKENINDAYMFVNGGEIRVEHINETEYRFEIVVKGLNANGGVGNPYEGRYEGEPDITGLGTTNDSFIRVDDFVMTEIELLASAGGSALWLIYMYDEGYFELVTKGATNLLPAKVLSFVLISDFTDAESLPKGTYTIDMLNSYSHNTILDASYQTYSDYELDPETNKIKVTTEIYDILTDGYLKVNPKGKTTVGTVEYPMYSLDIVGFGVYDGYKFYYDDIVAFYDNSKPDYELVPIHYTDFSMAEALYWGPQAANESGTVMTKPLWQMQFKVNTEEYGEQLIAMELFTDDGNTFEQGIPSGTYTVEPMNENLDVTKANFIFPGYYTKDDEGSLDGIYGTYIAGDFETDEESGKTYFNMLYDCIQGGTMTVDNKGDGNYKLEMNFTGAGNMSFSEITGLYEGAITTFDGTAIGEEGDQQQVAAPKKNHKVRTASARFEIESNEVSVIAKPAKTNLFERNYR